jgi:exodeoxyribonuclease V alpha subunit
LGTVRRRLGAPEPKATPFPERLVHAARASDVGEETLYLSWELARSATDLEPEEREALLSVAVASLNSLERGSTHLPLDRLAERLRYFGADDALVARAETLMEEPRALIGRPGDYKPLIIDDGRLYHQRVHQQEVSLARNLKARLEAKSDRSQYMKILDALDRVLAHRAVVNGRVVRLSAEQQDAVRTAVTRALSVVSGGPGTGKTSVVVAILRVLARLEVAMANVALAAPTGRAARRMAESVQGALGAVPEPKIVDGGILETLPEARTLHRLLGYSPAGGRFRHDEANPLPYALVIVDEASMIDLELMDRLLRALRPQTQLVLLGDADQLPSVHAGAVLGDIVSACEKRGSIVLRENYRVDRKDAAGRALAEAFRSIQTEDFHTLMKSIAVRRQASEVAFHGVELLEEDHEGFLVRWMSERVMPASYLELVRREPFDAGAALGHLRRHGMLAVTSHDAERINETCRLRHPSRRGEPILVTRNDYERGLFNGERGVISGISASGVHFETGATDALREDLSTAYAITVHKSQGAEYDHVAVWLPSYDHPLLTRELLYTAMTRARKSVTLVGSKEAVSAGFGRALERTTGILSRLA